MQPADLKSKPRCGKGLRDLIYRAIGVCFYPPPGSEHYKLIILERFHGSNCINDKRRNNDETKVTGIV